MAQRALNRRLAEEIGRIRTSFQELGRYLAQLSGCLVDMRNVHICFHGPPHRALSRIREHDDFVSQQAEQAHQQLFGALEQAQANSESVQTTPFHETPLLFYKLCNHIRFHVVNNTTQPEPLVFPSVVQGYHELYELHRSRLETQLLHTMKERDCWVQLALSLTKKVLHLNCF